jgi:hypothetical protein
LNPKTIIFVVIIALEDAYIWNASVYEERGVTGEKRIEALFTKGRLYSYLSDSVSGDGKNGSMPLIDTFLHP